MPGATQEVVHFHAGGVPGVRPVLRGKEAKPTFDDIPTVDMANIFSAVLEERKAIAVQVGNACRDVGFFYAVNHNVPDAVVARTFAAVADFFAQTSEAKLETHINHSDFFRGYEPLFETKLDDASSRGDLKESYSMGDDGTDAEQQANVLPGRTYAAKNQWPRNGTGRALRTALYDYYAYVYAFSRQLLHVFALALDLPEAYFDAFCRFPMTTIRALHYPPQEAATAAGAATATPEVGLGAHTDYCMFTLVCQDDVPALQVLNDNGIWVDAPPRPRSFVVNIGDFLMQVTGGAFRSTVHRVVNLTGQRRYSMPFFFSPDETATLSVPPQMRQPGRTYEDMPVNEYFRKRLFAARYKHPAVLRWKAEQAAAAAAAAGRQ